MDFKGEFEKLYFSQPHNARFGFQSENSDYGDQIYYSKNCYLVFICEEAWDCVYGFWVLSSKNCVDCSYTDRCDFCYECVDCTGCFNCNYLQDSHGTSDSFYSYDLRSCRNCFGCVSLRHKEHHIFNEPYSKDEYEIKTAELKKKSEAEIYEMMKELLLKSPRVAARFVNTENSTGDYLNYARDCNACFNSDNLRDCGYIFDDTGHKKRSTDCYDIWSFAGSELCYEGCSVGYSYNCNFCLAVERCKDSEFCIECYNSRKLFGCVGVNHGEYMILNQTYDPETWERKVAEIRAELRKDGNYGMDVIYSIARLREIEHVYSLMV